MATMNSTVLRVKRKINDLPLSTLVIACKRPKTDEQHLSLDSSDSNLEITAQFVGTLLNRSEDLHKIMSNGLHFEKLELCKSSKRTSDNEDKHEIKKFKWIDVNSTVEKVKVTKYKNLSTEKGKDEQPSAQPGTDPKEVSQDDSQSVSEEKWTFIDMEDEWSNFLKTSKQRQNTENYVYDLYYVDKDVWLDSDKIYVQVPKGVDIYLGNESSPDEDSSDSNSESNWRNDYPDSDPFESDDDSMNSVSSEEIYFGRYHCDMLKKIRALKVDSSSSSDTSDSEMDSDSDSDFHRDNDLRHIMSISE